MKDLFIVKEALKKNVGAGKQWETTQALLDECEEICNMAGGAAILSQGGYFDVSFSILIPILKRIIKESEG